MGSEENLRKLGNSITALEEEADKLRKHVDALLKNRSRFKPDHLSMVARDVGRVVNECKNYYQNYFASLGK